LGDILKENKHFYLDFFNEFMANYRKLKVHEVGTDTYIDYEANVSDI
jgi:hypothetical protein